MPKRLVKKSLDRPEKSDKSNYFTGIVGEDLLDKIEQLYEKITDNHEFEFVFFAKKGKGSKYLQQEKYINLLKFMKVRSEQKKFKITEPTDVLDISYFEDDVNYRCSIENADNINRIMKKLTMMRNHVVFKTIINMLNDKKDVEGVSLMKKEKNADEMVDIDEFDIRVRLSTESNLTKDDMKKMLAIDENAMKKITFRYKQRTSVYVVGDDESDEFVRVDLTFTKMADSFRKINRAFPNYELEVEYGLNNKSKKQSKQSSKDGLSKIYDEVILLLKIIQQSNFPIPNTMTKNVLEYYANLFSLPQERSAVLDARQSSTLEIQHVTEVLANKYAVTDKADGERQFLIIFQNKIYLIDSNTNVKDTGIVLDDSKSKYNGSVMDGELIFIPHKNRHIFLVFDCIFYQGQNIRPTIKLFDRIAYADDIIENCFVIGKQSGYVFTDMNFDKQSDKQFDMNKRNAHYHNEIKKMIDNLNSDMEIDKLHPLIRRKFFIGATGAKDWEIFSYALTMWNSFTSSPDVKCPYFLDGLIFQPLEQAYVANSKDSRQQDYKWKPPEKNSIDFYIEFEKDQDGKILTIYDNSYNDSYTDLEFVRNKPYKICKLHVGQKNKGTETPVLFKNEQIASAYIFLTDGEVRDSEGGILSDNTVVEFYYNNDPEVLDRFRWVPLRTRYDKTEAVLKRGVKYGNSAFVADRVWRSIENPMLMSDFEDLARGNNPEKNSYYYDKKMESLRKKIGHELIISATKENTYFQKRTELAKPMRNFHNWIKSNIIYTFCHPMYQSNRQLSVLDFGCGKGQDYMKFFYAMVAFYVGIDIDKEGLVSGIDGAISRYNQGRKRRPNFPKMYFLQGDTAAPLDLESQRKAMNVKKLVNEELFPKFFSEEQSGRTMFDRINCQFVIHYMLRNEDTWANFKQNVNNHLRNGGFFLVTTFDAEKVRKLLGNSDKYTQEYTDENGKTQILFEIVKKYDDKKIIHGTGNPIDVYIAWFSHEGRYLTEYLVDPEFLKEDLNKSCSLKLVDTDGFGNQLTIHKPYLTEYSKYEESDETRGFLQKVASFYKNDGINDGCRVWNTLFRYYVFRKDHPNDGQTKKQKGGSMKSSKLEESTESAEFDDDNLLDFSDKEKFFVPEMDRYNSDYSFMNSIHHLLQSHGIIPKTLIPKNLSRDLGLQDVKDEDIKSNINSIAGKIIIEHNIESHKTERIIDGLHIFTVERDCNDDYDISLTSKETKSGKTPKKIKKNDRCVILMKEGLLYVPVYHIDSESGQKTGIFTGDHPIIIKMLDDM